MSEPEETHPCLDTPDSEIIQEAPHDDIKSYTASEPAQNPEDEGGVNPEKSCVTEKAVNGDNTPKEEEISETAPPVSTSENVSNSTGPPATESAPQEINPNVHYYAPTPGYEKKLDKAVLFGVRSLPQSHLTEHAVFHYISATFRPHLRLMEPMCPDPDCAEPRWAWMCIYLDTTERAEQVAKVHNLPNRPNFFVDQNRRYYDIVLCHTSFGGLGEAFEKAQTARRNPSISNEEPVRTRLEDPPLPVSVDTPRGQMLFSTDELLHTEGISEYFLSKGQTGKGVFLRPCKRFDPKKKMVCRMGAECRYAHLKDEVCSKQLGAASIYDPYRMPKNVEDLSISTWDLDRRSDSLVLRNIAENVGLEDVQYMFQECEGYVSASFLPDEYFPVAIIQFQDPQSASQALLQTVDSGLNISFYGVVEDLRALLLQESKTKGKMLTTPSRLPGDPIREHAERRAREQQERIAAQRAAQAAAPPPPPPPAPSPRGRSDGGRVHGYPGSLPPRGHAPPPPPPHHRTGAYVAYPPMSYPPHGGRSYPPDSRGWHPSHGPPPPPSSRWGARPLPPSYNQRNHPAVNPTDRRHAPATSTDHRYPPRDTRDHSRDHSRVHAYPEERARPDASAYSSSTTSSPSSSRHYREPGQHEKGENETREQQRETHKPNESSHPELSSSYGSHHKESGPNRRCESKRGESTDPVTTASTGSREGRAHSRSEAQRDPPSNPVIPSSLDHKGSGPYDRSPSKTKRWTTRTSDTRRSTPSRETRRSYSRHRRSGRDRSRERRSRERVSRERYDRRRGEEGEGRYGREVRRRTGYGERDYEERQRSYGGKEEGGRYHREERRTRERSPPRGVEGNTGRREEKEKGGEERAAERKVPESCADFPVLPEGWTFQKNSMGKQYYFYRVGEEDNTTWFHPATNELYYVKVE